MPDGITEFDFEKFDAEWEQNSAEESTIEEETETETLENDLHEAETDVDLGVVGDDEEETPPAQIHESDEQKRNRAFADLRRERDEAKRQADFLQRIAEENGTTVEEMERRYTESRLEEEAETQGVPVEVLQRIQQLEQENQIIKNQTFSERFNKEVEQTIEKYKASTEEIEATMAYAGQNGLVDAMQAGNLSFDAIHRMTHFDAIMERQVQTALQTNLTQKKKRQQEAPLAQGAVASPSAETMEERAMRDAASILADW